MSNPFRIGIFGGGQLGRMMALAATSLNARCSFYEPTPDCPANVIGSVFGDDSNSETAVGAFLDSADVFTYEFENISTDLVRRIADHKPVYPSIESLRISQNRLNEKRLFAELNIPSARFYEIRQETDIVRAAADLGLPLVIKTVTQGYDGRGQFLLKNEGQIADAWASLGAQAPLIAEEFVHFRRELSIIAVRGHDGKSVCYPLTENTHHQGILSHSIAPAPFVEDDVQMTAEKYISTLLTHLDHVGALTLEMFETRHGLVANETAPRVHNSGHWSIEGSHCSQFENHIRAILGLPLGSTYCAEPTAMINIIGQHPRTEDILQIDDAHLHLYGKIERPARKLGHITVTARTHHDLEDKVKKIATLLPNPMALGIAK